MQKYANAPGSAPFVSPIADIQAVMGDQWTFISEDDTFRGFATIGGDVVHKDMDEELVYQLVSAYIATLDELKAKAEFIENPLKLICEGLNQGFNAEIRHVIGNLLEYSNPIGSMV